MDLFRDSFSPKANTRILDVGGSPEFWEESNVPAVLTILNLEFDPSTVERLKNKYEIVSGDGTNLPYTQRQFDIVFSNSVIEHVGTFEQQHKFASEARRVGKRLWVQTPAKCFFIEPHLITPFVHWLPKWLRKRLLRYGTTWGWLTKPTKADVENFLNEVRLLTYKEMLKLFPDCKIHRERFFGLTKSYIAIRKNLG
jgi:hypothetical protein